MYIDHDERAFSRFANQATIPRTLIRAICLHVLAVVALAHLALYALAWGEPGATPAVLKVLTLCLFAAAIAEHVSAICVNAKSLVANGPYVLFLLFSAGLTASMLDKSFGLVALFGLAMIGSFIYIARTDPFFRSVVVDEIEDENEPFVETLPRSPTSVRRSVRRKSRKNRRHN